MLEHSSTKKVNFSNFIYYVFRYFHAVLTSGKLAPDGNEIQLHQDGSWSSLIVKKEQTRVLSPTVSMGLKKKRLVKN